MRTLEGCSVPSSQHDGKLFCKQLTRRLESQSTVRAGDQRDSHFSVAHYWILIASHDPHTGAFDAACLEAPCRGRARYIAAVAHVSAAAGLIWANEIGAEDRAPFLGDERVLVRSQPVGECVRFAYLRIDCVSLPCSDDWPDD